MRKRWFDSNIISITSINEILCHKSEHNIKYHEIWSIFAESCYFHIKGHEIYKFGLISWNSMAITRILSIFPIILFILNTYKSMNKEYCIILFTQCSKDKDKGKIKLWIKTMQMEFYLWLWAHWRLSNKNIMEKEDPNNLELMIKLTIIQSQFLILYPKWLLSLCFCICLDSNLINNMGTISTNCQSPTMNRK